MNPYNCIMVLGPTASGKTNLAVKLAHAFHTEIISADSRQVYRQLTIGSGKDLDAYHFRGASVPIHLIDVADVNENYHLNRYLVDFEKVFGELLSKTMVPVICGGTSLYIHALLRQHTLHAVPVNEALRKELRGLTEEGLGKRLEMIRTPKSPGLKADTRNRLIRAVEINAFLVENRLQPTPPSSLHPLIFGIDSSREERRERITTRLQHRLENGLIEEVKELLETGITPERLMFLGLEYRYITLYITGKMSYHNMQTRLDIAIQQFAKRQMTWLRKFEREGHEIIWVKTDEEAITIARERLNAN